MTFFRWLLGYINPLRAFGVSEFGGHIRSMAHDVAENVRVAANPLIEDDKVENDFELAIRRLGINDLEIEAKILQYERLIARWIYLVCLPTAVLAVWVSLTESLFASVVVWLLALSQAGKIHIWQMRLNTLKTRKFQAAPGALIALAAAGRKIAKSIAGLLPALAIALCLVCTPSLALAQVPAGGGGSHWYQVQPNDLSYRLLAAIFGDNTVSAAANFQPNGSGGGPESAIDAAMKQFNSSLLVTAALLMIFGLVTGIVHTANSAEWIQRNASSFWLPLRSTLSFGALIPLSNGLSFVQYLVLVMALQGAGAANAMWHDALSYIMQTGTLISGVDYAPNETQIQNLANILLRARVCEQTYDQLAAQHVADFPGSGGSPGKIIWVEVSPGKYVSYESPDGTTKVDGTGGVCGSYDVPEKLADVSKIGASIGLDTSAYNTISESLLGAHQKGLEEMLAAVDPLALPFADYAINGGSFSPPDPAALKSAIDSYANGVTQALANAVTNIPQDGNSDLYGWATAGAWYWRIAGVQNAIQASVDAVPTSSAPNLTLLSCDFCKGTLDTAVGKAGEWAAANGASAESAEPNAIARAASWLGDKLSGIGSALSGVSNLYAAAQALNKAIINLGVLSLTNQDPILEVRRIGVAMIGFAPVLAAASVLVAPLGIPMALMLMVAGVGLGLYLPAIPLIGWVSAMASWLVAVVMSVVAGPLWAVANSTTEGDSWVTMRAEQGVNFVIGLVTRPVLNIFGLVAGAELLRVMVWMVGQIAAPGLAAIVNAGFGSHPIVAVPVSFMEAWAALMIMAGLTVHVAHMSYALIHKIPEHVLGWLQHHASFGDDVAHHNVQAIIAGGYAKMGQTVSGVGKTETLLTPTGRKFVGQIKAAFGGLSLSGVPKQINSGGPADNPAGDAGKAQMSSRESETNIR